MARAVVSGAEANIIRVLDFAKKLDVLSGTHTAQLVVIDETASYMEGLFKLWNGKISKAESRKKADVISDIQIKREELFALANKISEGTDSRKLDEMIRAYEPEKDSK